MNLNWHHEAFHNGDVKKMWGWWVQKDPLRSTAAPGVIVQPSHIEVSTDFQGIIGDGLSVTVLSSTDHARTLKDLLNMTSAAKSAQWGEHDDLEASSLAFPVLGANFFDDDSEGMSESDENDDDDLVDSTGLKTGQMHENYFNDNQHSLFAQDDQSEENLVHGNKYDGLHADINPTTMASGILTPLVQVSRKYNLLAFNNQCAELALTLKLRSFKSLDEKECVPSNESHKVSSSLSNRTNSKRDKVDVVVSSGIQSKRGIQKTLVFCIVTGVRKVQYRLTFVVCCCSSVLPSYRSLLPAARESSNPPHALKTHKQDERGVHGGEYSVRPNMHESMVFLRKLFIHQNQDENKAAFQSLLSPPDNPMMSTLHLLFS